MRSFTIARAAVLPFLGLALAACVSGPAEEYVLGKESVPSVEEGKGAPEGSQSGAEEGLPSDEADGTQNEADAGPSTGEPLDEGKEIEAPLPGEITKGEISKGEISKGEETPEIPAKEGPEEGAPAEPADVTKAPEPTAELPSKGEFAPVSPTAPKGEFAPILPKGDSGALTPKGLVRPRIDLGARLPPRLDYRPSGDSPPKGDLARGGRGCPNALARTPEVVGACVQAITYARNPATGECCVYATPCEVPHRWNASFSRDDVCR
ncbi:hypothetical protein [Polyangium spumosum]|uniref:Uncharacterized protein n=1 Tax=Polyangium spumosum TaxID=889282 RepID=A0A6N7Q051_9BACT|nr:hypothetical protein [Polyangium spumosum]MRG95905.1 hypothetical protein [Polyangium spumosum]